MLVNGKRKWPEELKARYEELVTTFVNTPEANTAITKGSTEFSYLKNVGTAKVLIPDLLLAKLSVPIGSC